MSQRAHRFSMLLGIFLSACSNSDAHGAPPDANGEILPSVDAYLIDELSSLGEAGKTISDEASLRLPGVVGDVAGGTAPEDADRDGMADGWELSHGLNANDPGDGNDDRNGDGWTNLEEYINALAP